MSLRIRVMTSNRQVPFLWPRTDCNKETTSISKNVFLLIRFFASFSFAIVGQLMTSTNCCSSLETARQTVCVLLVVMRGYLPDALMGRKKGAPLLKNYISEPNHRIDSQLVSLKAQFPGLVAVKISKLWSKRLSIYWLGSGRTHFMSNDENASWVEGSIFFNWITQTGRWSPNLGSQLDPLPPDRWASHFPCFFFLFAAAQEGHESVAKLLLAGGADPNRADGCGRTALKVNDPTSWPAASFCPFQHFPWKISCKFSEIYIRSTVASVDFHWRICWPIDDSWRWKAVTRRWSSCWKVGRSATAACGMNPSAPGIRLPANWLPNRR